MTFVPGQTLTAAELNQLIPPNAGLIGGTGTTFSIVHTGSGVALSGGTLSANWQLGTVAALLGLAIVSGSLEAQWQGPAITALGSGVSSAGGTLSATGTGGSVTSVSVGAGLSGGPITTAGTLVANYQGGTLTTFGTGITLTGGTLTPNFQAGVLTAFKSGLTLAAGTLAPDWNGGSVAAIGPGITNASGTLEVAQVPAVTLVGTAAGTLTLSPAVFADVVVQMPNTGGTVTLNVGSVVPRQRVLIDIVNGATLGTVALQAGVSGSSHGFIFGSTVTTYAPGAVNTTDNIICIAPSATLLRVEAIDLGFAI